MVEMGTQETGEHGLGAGLSTGRQPRVRPLKRQGVVFFFDPNGAPAKADGFCGEEEMPSHWRNFLLAENGAVWLAR